MRLTSDNFDHGDRIPAGNAFGVVDPDTHLAFGPNRNPHLRWDGAPDGTRSYVIICADGDVPTRPDDVNQEGREVPSDLPRTEFIHWVAVDVPATCTEIDEGAFAEGVVAKGKDRGAGPMGVRQGLNDYTGWFAGDPDMGGDYHGYDGPCPPWNDSIVHHYVFTLYALDVEACDVDGSFTAADVRRAMDGHVLDATELMGIYTLNPRLA
jgi:Raf kinase inhibitor-like YbhB/YbcL family protein